MKEKPAESVCSEEWAIERTVVEQFNAAGFWTRNSEGPAETDQTVVQVAGVDARMRSTGTQEERGLYRLTLKWRSVAAFFVLVESFVE